MAVDGSLDFEKAEQGFLAPFQVDNSGVLGGWRTLSGRRCLGLLGSLGLAMVRGPALSRSPLSQSVSCVPAR